MLAICLAAIAGFHGPGRRAAKTLSFLVDCRRAWENDTDSCWFSCWILLVIVELNEKAATNSSVSCHESNLSQREFESNVLSCLGISDIGFVVPPDSELEGVCGEDVE